MAKVTYGPLVSDVSGAVGPVVFRRNNGGPSLQMKAAARKNVSQEQAYALALASQAAKAWSTRTERDMRSWENWAIQHPESNRSGHRKPPPIYPTFMKRSIYNLWCQSTVGSTRVTREPFDDVTTFRVFTSTPEALLYFRAYGLTSFWLSACWFRLVPNTVGRYARRPWSLLWRHGLRMPVSGVAGSDSYGSYFQLNAADASEYFYGFVTGPCYAEFRITADTAAYCYAQRVLGPLAVSPVV